MKSERRHELQQNQLALWLGRKVDAVRPYWMTIVGLLLAALAVWFTVKFVVGRGAVQREQAWNQFFSAQNSDVDELKKVIEEHEDAEAARGAHLALGQLLQSRGNSLLLTNREEAIKMLEESREHYLSVLKEAGEPLPKVLEQIVTFELGRVNESLSEFDQAKEYYGRFDEEDWSDSSMAPQARELLANLEQESTQKWYAWHLTAKQTPGGPTTPRGAGKDPARDLDDLDDINDAAKMADLLDELKKKINDKKVPDKKTSDGDVESDFPDTKNDDAPDKAGDKSSKGSDEKKPNTDHPDKKKPADGADKSNSDAKSKSNTDSKPKDSKPADKPPSP